MLLGERRAVVAEDAKPVLREPIAEGKEAGALASLQYRFLYRLPHAVSSPVACIIRGCEQSAPVVSSRGRDPRERAGRIALAGPGSEGRTRPLSTASTWRIVGDRSGATRHTETLWGTYSDSAASAERSGRGARSDRAWCRPR